MNKRMFRKNNQRRSLILDPAPLIQHPFDGTFKERGNWIVQFASKDLVHFSTTTGHFVEVPYKIIRNHVEGGILKMKRRIVFYTDRVTDVPID